MVDINRIFASITQGGFATGVAGGLAGGALTGALASKKGRKTAMSLLKYGGAAAVGGLAWNAYRKYQEDRRTEASSSTDEKWQRIEHEQFDLSRQDDAQTEAQTEANGLLIIRAMITAAMSDGHLDAAEQRRIFAHTDEVGLNPAEKATLFDELRNPKPIEEIAAAARDPALAVEIYTASVLTIDASTPDGKAYLERLAQLLGLPDALVRALHEEAGNPSQAAA